MKEELLELINESWDDEEVKEAVKNRFKKAIEDSIDSAFRWGEIRRALENRIKETLVPYIEGYDFSAYIPKLDSVLTDLLNSEGCMADKKILENFKSLCQWPEKKEINVSELFKEWIKYCNKEIDTDGLEVVFDDCPSYEPVECSMEVEKQDERSWSCFEYASIILENDHDEDLNAEIVISRFKDFDKENEYAISAIGRKDVKITSLRSMNDFQVLLMRMEMAGTKIIVDSVYEGDYIYPEKEPEVTFS